MSKNKLIYIVGAIFLAVVSFDLHSQSIERLSFPQVAVSNGTVNATAGSAFCISLSGANGSLTISSEYGEGDFYNEVGIEEDRLVLEDGISIYPNPTDYFVNIIGNVETFEGDKSVEIYDAGGRLVLSSQITTFAPEITIDVSQVPQGVYIIRIGNESVKMIKR
jgi:hypothetical protein